MQVHIPLPPRQRRLVIFACMVMYTAVMCVNIGASVILPKMLQQIGGMEFYSFASVVNAIGIMISAPVVGKLGDALGRKWLCVGAMLFHMTLLLLISFCRVPILFIILYTFAGIGIGLYIGMAHTIIGDVVPIDERGKYYGTLAACGAAGMLFGPFINGLIVDSGHPQYAFYVSFPLLLLSSVLLLLYYPNKATVQEKIRLDILGLALLVVGIGCISLYINFGGSKFSYVSAVGLSLLASGIVAIVFLLRHVKRVETPIIDITLFRYRGFTIAWIVRFFFTAYLLCATNFLILYAQNAMGVSGTVSSTLAMPQTIGMMILAPAIGRLVNRNQKSFRPLYIALGLCTATALFLWSFVKPDSSLILLYMGMAIGGIGYTTEQTISTPYFQRAIRPELYGAAQGMSFFASSAGGTLWGAIYGAVLSDQSIVTQMHPILRIATCIMLACAGIGFVFVRTPENEAGNY